MIFIQKHNAKHNGNTMGTQCKKQLYFYPYFSIAPWTCPVNFLIKNSMCHMSCFLSLALQGYSHCCMYQQCNQYICWFRNFFSNWLHGSWAQSSNWQGGRRRYSLCVTISNYQTIGLLVFILIINIKLYFVNTVFL